MTALIAPSRATSFEGLIFFVYDREAVKKEADPPENAIVYFYPPSASIEDRISICGQLIGMSYFIHGFIGSRPALCKLQTEKVATVYSGKYTLALGGSLDEPDSLLIRQLGTLHSTFTFYHGSLERIRMMCETQKQFLTHMNVIWDCYLHFVRHYGDFLPGVFDPLPFLDLPKRVATTCFTKASYILQACQRRKHILGGCILYSNSILCTQFEPSITERLILLKPNQRNHPAKPVKTEHALPFGVRILNAFLTLSEYLNLYEALSDSAYRQPTSPESTGAFPDMYMTSQSFAGTRNSSGDPSSEKLQQVSSDVGANSREDLGRGSTEREIDSVVNSNGSLASVLPSDEDVGAEIQTKRECKDSKIMDQREPILKRGTDCLSTKEFRDEDFDNSDQSSGESRSELKATGTRKICAQNSDEFNCRNERGVRTAVKDVKKAGDEKIGSVATALVTEKKTGMEKDENEASVLIAEKYTGKEQNGSEACEREAEKRTGEEKDENEPDAMITEKRTGEEQSGSEVGVPKTEEGSNGVLVKPGYNAVDDVDASSMAFDSSSCESTSCNNVNLSVGGEDMFGLKVTTSYITAFDSSSSESTLSNDVSLTMEAIDVSGLKVVECSNSQIEALTCLGGDSKTDKIVPRSSSDGSKRRTLKSLENEGTAICALVLEELITQVCEMIENDNSFLDNDGVQCASASGACCQACADAQKSRDVSSQGTNVRRSHGQKAENNVTSTSKTDAPSIDQDLERELANLSLGFQKTKLHASDRRDGEETNCRRQTKRPCSAENVVITDAYSSKDDSLRTDLIKTPIVCDSFSVRNLNSRSPEKFLEKSFTSTDTGFPDYSESANPNAPCSTVVETTSGIRKTERNVSENANSNGPFSVEEGHRMPVETSQIRETGRRASENASLSGAGSADVEDGNPVTPSHLSIEFDSEIHIANGHERPSMAEEIGVPIDTAREEIEDSSPCDHHQWRELPLPSHPDEEEEEELWSEEERDDLNQVEGLTHVNLYVQAHSKVVLILLAEEGLNTDCNAIKALWETSLNQLGELEFLVKQSSGNETTTLHSDEYSFLVYDGFERTMKGNLNDLVHQVDHLFCETTKVLHEQFENCSTLKDVMLRNHSSTVYGKRNLGRGTYFHSKASYRTTPGIPSHRDRFLKLEERATKILNKEHGVNIF